MSLFSKPGLLANLVIIKFCFSTYCLLILQLPYKCQQRQSAKIATDVRRGISLIISVLKVIKLLLYIYSNIIE